MSKKIKTVVLNDSFLNEDHMARLRALGRVDICLDTKTTQQVIERLKGADVAIIDMWEAPMNRETLSNLPSVKFMTINSTGFDMVDLAAAQEYGITVSNIPGFGTQSVAEHTIALMLAVSHHIVDGHEAIRAGRPFQLDPANREHDKFLGFNVFGKTIGIIGLGQIGIRVAELAQGLGMRVIAYNRTNKHVKGVEITSLDNLLRTSDVISINGALTPDQENIINKSSLRFIKPTSIIINTARGGFINDIDLAEAINSCRLAGAGLDFLQDWSPENPLLHTKNVVVNPHSAWFTKEALSNLAEIVTQNVEAYASGSPKNVIT